MRSHFCGRTLVLAITLMAFGGIAVAKDKNPAPKAPTPEQSKILDEIACDRAKTTCKNDKAARDLLKRTKPRDSNDASRDSTAQR